MNANVLESSNTVPRGLPVFRLKTLPTQEFTFHEQAIEENVYMSFTLFYSHFQRRNRLSALAEALAANG